MKQLEKLFNLLSPPFQVFVLAADGLFTFGIVGPSMISSNSTIAVWLGIFICFTSAYLIWRLGKPLFNKLLKETHP